MPVPSAHIVEVVLPAGYSTLTAKVFTKFSDTVFATAGGVTQETNRLAIYSVSFTYPTFAASDDPYTLVVYSNGVPIAVRYFIVKVEADSYLSYQIAAHESLVSLLLSNAIRDQSFGWDAAESPGVPTTYLGKLRRWTGEWFFKRTRNRTERSEHSFAADGTTELHRRDLATTEALGVITDTVTTSAPVAP